MSSVEASATRLSAEEIARAAPAAFEDFRERIRDVPYESKGILYSEMFFLFLCARRLNPGRIIESGRARGQSTLLLAKCFPELPIVSIEHDRGSPDVPVAEGRLRTYRNVELRYGDAMRLLPAIAEPGDVVLIDGPKSFRALRLALRLLAQDRASLVFVHDMGQGTSERRFLESRLPATLYSDDPGFAEVAHVLDAPAVAEIPAPHRWTAKGAELGYGFGLACLPHLPGVSYPRAWWAAVLAGLKARLGN